MAWSSSLGARGIPSSGERTVGDFSKMLEQAVDGEESSILSWSKPIASSSRDVVAKVFLWIPREGLLKITVSASVFVILEVLKSGLFSGLS